MCNQKELKAILRITEIALLTGATDGSGKLSVQSTQPGKSEQEHSGSRQEIIEKNRKNENNVYYRRRNSRTSEPDRRGVQGTSTSIGCRRKPSKRRKNDEINTSGSKKPAETIKIQFMETVRISLKDDQTGKHWTLNLTKEQEERALEILKDEPTPVTNKLLNAAVSQAIQELPINQ